MEKTIEIPEIDLPKPQSNDLKELIEYQNIYQFYIQKIKHQNIKKLMMKQ